MKEEKQIEVHEIYQTLGEARLAVSALESAFSTLAQIGNKAQAREQVLEARKHIAKVYMILGRVLGVKGEES